MFEKYSLSSFFGLDERITPLLGLVMTFGMGCAGADVDPGGDGFDETEMVQRQDSALSQAGASADTGAWIFSSTESGAFSPSAAWRSGPGNWGWSNSRLVAGQFTNDGRADIAAFYDYGNADTGLWLFGSTGSGTFSPALVWRSGSGNWAWGKSQWVAGDFTGDGKADIAAFYDYGNADTGLWLFRSTGSGTFSPALVWRSGPGNWAWGKGKLVAGDFNGDGKADIAAAYDYGNANTGLWLFSSTGSGFSVSRPWLSGAGNWAWDRSQWVAGDFNGDGKEDIAAAYDYENANTGLWLFRSTGPGFSVSRPWLSGAGNWAWNRSQWVAGDFNGDGKADIAAFYNYGS